MHDIFISYSHMDEKIRDGISRRLEADGISCWYAPRDIRPGQEWAEAVIGAIQNCRAVVLLFSEGSAASAQVLREAAAASDLNRTIIPVKLDETIPTGSMQYYLSSLQWLDASRMEPEEAAEELSVLCRNFLTGKQEAGPVPPKRNGEKDQRRIIYLLTAVILALTAIAALFLISGTRSAENRKTEDPAGIAAEQQPAVSKEQKKIDYHGKTYVFDPEKDAPGSENYLYTIIDSKVRLDAYKGIGEAEVSVPNIIDGLPCAVISRSCFEENEEITKVILPETVEEIETGAFAGCSKLREIVFPDSLTAIGDLAFYGTGLTAVMLPPEIGSVETGLFLNCTLLETVILPEKANYINSGAFKGCKNLKTVVIPAKAVSIENEAFDTDAGVTLAGVPGSRTQSYARLKGLKFIEYDPETLYSALYDPQN